MIWLKNFFTIYLALLMLGIGAYMAFVQSNNLLDEKMKVEGRFLKIIGYIYIGISIVGIINYMI